MSNFFLPFLRRNFFERYRVLDENVAKPQKFSECAKVFNDCKDAEKYNDLEDDVDADADADTDADGDDDTKNEEQVDEITQKEESTEKSEEITGQRDDDENEGAGDSQDEQPKEHNTTPSNTIRRKRTHKPIRNYIMNRRIALEQSS